MILAFCGRGEGGMGGDRRKGGWQERQWDGSVVVDAVLHDALDLFDFPPALLDGALVDAVEILLKGDFLLESLGRLLLALEDDLDLLLEAADDFLLLGLLGGLFDFDLGPDEEELEGVLDGDLEVLRLAVHEELGEVEEVLALGRVLVDGALLVHVHELLLGDPAVEVLVELPHHALHLGLAHAHAHASQRLLQLLRREVLVGVRGGEVLEDLEQVLLLSGVDAELLQLFFHRLLLLRLPLPQLLHVELELPLRPVLLLEHDRVLVLPLQLRRQVPQPQRLLLFLHYIILLPRPGEGTRAGGGRVKWSWVKQGRADIGQWQQVGGCGSCINKMSEVRVSRSADELETALNQTLAQMQEHQKNGNYVEAESHRLQSEQLKRDLEARRIYEMEQRQAQENADLARAHDDELRNFNAFWDKKISEYAQEGERMTRDMEARHQADQDNTRADLEKTLPLRVKESSEFLNLKKMEDHMAKQRLYTEAEKVQARLAALEAAEKEAWLSNRSLKIETALNTLRARQAAELAALQKRIRTGLDEQNKDRKNEEARLNQKYNNIQKELRGNHDKEVMAFRGQFRSKGGQGSPLLLNKSKLLSSK